MAASMFLYWGSGSSPCWRPMIVLEEKGLSGYPNKVIEFSKKEHKTEEIMKLNPRGQVPTFRHGDVVVNESMAICDYLETTFPNQGTKLLPEDPAKRAFVLQRKFEALNLHKKGVEDCVYYLWRTKSEDQKQEVKEEKFKGLRTELDIWEGYLQQLGGSSYVAGADFSMADVIFFPTLAFLWRSGVNLEKYPSLNSYFQKMQQRASVVASWPPHWKQSDRTKMLEDV